MAAAFALVIGVVSGGWLRSGGTGIDQPAVTALVATANDSASDASLSVQVYSDGAGVSIRATVAGLRPTQRYRLSATTTDANTHMIREWAAVNGAQVVVGDLAVPAGTLVLFTVSEVDGAVVVSARCVPGPTSAGTPSAPR